MHPFFTRRLLLAELRRDRAMHGDTAVAKPGLLQRAMWLANQRWKRHKTIAALRAMDDHMLKDIGVNRYEITDIVDRPAHRDMHLVRNHANHNSVREEQSSLKLAA